MRCTISAFFLLALVFLPAACAQLTAASAEAQRAGANIAAAEKDMLDMASRNLPVARYNDTLFLAKQIYESQLSLESTGKKADYAFVEEKLRELADIKQKAYTAMDELKALEMALDKTADINKTAVLLIIGQARDEFLAERYENAIDLVNKGYAKISEEEAFQTKVSVFYEAASRGIAGFLARWWMELLIAFAAILIAVILTYGRIMRAIIERKIRMLEERKESVRKLIMQTQRDYFDKGKTGEETYHIRIRKYAEIIRDINRQIPLLREELAMKARKSGRGKAGNSAAK